LLCNNSSSRKSSGHYSTAAPNEFLLFFTLKMGLSGTHFATIEEIKSNATAKLRKVPKESLRWCFQQWKDWWSMCVCMRVSELSGAQSSYFQSDYEGAAVCSTVRVQYHHFENFLPAHSL
jgi:hypothetical protein